MYFLINVAFDNNSISLSSIIELLSNNYLNVLKIMNSIYLWKSRLEYEYVCEIAAKGGHYHCLKYLYEKTYRLFVSLDSFRLQRSANHVWWK